MVSGSGSLVFRFRIIGGIAGNSRWLRCLPSATATAADFGSVNRQAGKSMVKSKAWRVTSEYRRSQDGGQRSAVGGQPKRSEDGLQSNQRSEAGGSVFREDGVSVKGSLRVGKKWVKPHLYR
jgi:hypothetical protein